MKVDFSGIEIAIGLTYDESVMVSDLVSVFNARLANNSTRMDYYEDKNKFKNIGLTIPPDIASRIDTRVGWVAKAVDTVCARSIYDSITSNDADVSRAVNEIMDANDFQYEYAKAIPSQLVHGVGFITVTKGAAGEPGAVIKYHDATSAAALWDYRHNTVKCGFVVGDYELKSTRNGGEYQPSLVILYTPDAVVEIEKTGDSIWSATRMANLQGRCLMFAMPYLPSHSKPLGKSRVSAACMSITDEMQREMVRTSIHSEVFSSGQKALLGVSDEQYDALIGQKYRAAMTEMLLVTADENGNVPQITQMQQQSMQPHTEYAEMLMQRIAAETSLPVSAFGIMRERTSSDALRAQNDDVVLLTERLNRDNGKVIADVARMALAIASGKTFSGLSDDERAIAVHWIDPSMPSAASVADATSKLAAVVPEFGGTEIFWELNGFNEEQRKRVKTDMAANQQRTIAASIFGA